MRRNPEFQRNLWLEITPHRVIVTPLLLFGIYFLVIFLGTHNESVLLGISLAIFVVGTGLRGANQVENSMVGEIQSKTWPLQRLTSINPWAMTWGKLFGSTLFSWYAGFWSLLVFILTWFLVPEGILFPRPDSKWILLSHGIGPALLYAIGLVLWLQAWGFLAGMYHLQNMESTSKRKYGFASITGVFFLPVLLVSFFPVPESFVLHWYHWEFSLFWFGLVSLYIFLGWLMTGIYMQMRRELQVPNPPWVWAAFVIFILGYVMGFISEEENILPGELLIWVFRLSIGWVLMVGLTYMILWWERTDGVGIHRLIHLWNFKRVKDALCEIPRWGVTLILAWMVAVALMVVHMALGIDIPSKLTTFLMETKQAISSDQGLTFNLYGLVIAMMLFLMRDIALLLYFYFSAKPLRALGTAGVYWAVLYLLIPLLLVALSMDVLNPIFLPSATVNFVYAVLPPLLQAGLMWAFAIRRWRTRFGSPAV
jgi:hypothetical protein